MFIRTENFSQKLDKFESRGIKSLESKMSTLKNQLSKKKYYIMLNLLFSLDILMVSNIFRHFQYGINSFLNSFKLKSRDSLLKLPVNICFGFLNFLRYLFLGVASSTTSFLKSFDDLSRYYLGLSRRSCLDRYYDEEYYNNKFCIHKAVVPKSQISDFNTSNQYYMKSRYSEFSNNKFRNFFNFIIFKHTF